MPFSPSLLRFAPAACGFAAFFIAQIATTQLDLAMADCGVAFLAAYFCLYLCWKHWPRKRRLSGPPLD